MILTQIIKEKKKEVEEAKQRVPLDELLDKLNLSRERRNFKSNISTPHNINLIAEIKRSSPSSGIFRAEFVPVKIAEVYQMSGATALSILTDEKFFGGSLSHIIEVRKAVGLPILRKDFIIDEYQVYESLVAGSDAILLIAEILSKDELSRFKSISSDLEIDLVVEVHSEEDLKKTLEVDAEIIGINNRDLHSFKINLQTTSRLIRQIPKDKIIISESGIRTYEDVMFLKSLGINAVLIGEAFMTAKDIGTKVKEVMGY